MRERGTLHGETWWINSDIIGIRQVWGNFVPASCIRNFLPNLTSHVKSPWVRNIMSEKCPKRNVETTPHSNVKIGGYPFKTWYGCPPFFDGQIRSEQAREGSWWICATTRSSTTWACSRGFMLSCPNSCWNCSRWSNDTFDSKRAFASQRCRRWGTLVKGAYWIQVFPWTTMGILPLWTPDREGPLLRV